MIVVENFLVEVLKIKVLVVKLKEFELNDVFIVIGEVDENLFLVVCNLYKVDVCDVIGIDLVSLIVFDKVLMIVVVVK